MISEHSILGTYFIISCVDEDLVKNFIKARNIVNFSIGHATMLLVKNPKVIAMVLSASDVCIGAKKDVLKLRQLRNIV